MLANKQTKNTKQKTHKKQKAKSKKQKTHKKKQKAKKNNSITSCRSWAGNSLILQVLGREFTHPAGLGPAGRLWTFTYTLPTTFQQHQQESATPAWSILQVQSVGKQLDMDLRGGGGRGGAKKGGKKKKREMFESSNKKKKKPQEPTKGDGSTAIRL
jgi:hypothetical protein